jgi:hypothetical protein
VRYHTITAVTDEGGRYHADQSFTNGEFHPAQEAKYEVSASGFAPAWREVPVDPSTRWLYAHFHLIGLAYFPQLDSW